MPATQRQFLDNGLKLLDQKPNLHIIIDWEDSLKNSDTKSEMRNKDLGRKTTAEYAHDFKKYLHRVWVRINGIHTRYFADDLQTMFYLKCQIDGVVLPKAEDAEAVQELQQYFNVIPLIESQKGFANRENLMASNVQFVRFGPQDYFFEKQVFPLPQSPHVSALFDTVIDDFLITAEQHDTVFVCPIFNNLKLEENFLKAHRYIFQKLHKTRIGVTVLTPTQLEWIEKLQNQNWHTIQANHQSYTLKELETLAQLIISAHEKRENHDLSVSHLRESGHYVTPYQYIAAKKFLDQIRNDQEAF